MTIDVTDAAVEDEFVVVTRASVVPRFARSDVRIAAALSVAAFALRLPLLAKVPVEWDSANLIAGVRRFDVRHNSPHPPGYWLLILAGRALHFVGFSAATSLALVAALFTALAVGVCYLVGVRLSGRALGFACALFLGTVPIALFYGTIQNSYAADFLASCLLMLIAADARPAGRHHIAAAVVIGLASGFRPSGILMYVPIGLFALWRVRGGLRALWQLIGAAAVAVAVWVVPESIQQHGGLVSVLRETHALWDSAGSRTSILQGASADAWTRNIVTTMTFTFVCVALLGVVVVACLGAWVGLRVRPSVHGWVFVMLACAGVPSLGVTMLYFGKAGYILAYLPAFVVFVLYPVFAVPGLARRVGVAAACGVAALNVVIYTQTAGALPDQVLSRIPVVRSPAHGYPYGVTLSAVHSVEAQVRPWRALRGRIDPARDELFFVAGVGELPARQIMWELPEFAGHVLGVHGEAIEIRHSFEYKQNGQFLIQLPPGGRAIYVLGALPSQFVLLRDRGIATPLQLPTGVSAFIVNPGHTVMGYDIQSR